MNKEQLLERYFEVDLEEDGVEEFDAYYPKNSIHIEYRGDRVNCVEMGSFLKSRVGGSDWKGRPVLYVNADRDSGWMWDEVDMQDISVYQLIQLDITG